MSYTPYNRPKIGYPALVALNLQRIHAQPGDILEVRLTNAQEETISIYGLAKRAMTTYLTLFYFYPQVVAVHPDHLAILKCQAKRLDVIIPDGADKELRARLRDLKELPTQVEWEADDTLDLFTAAARYRFTEDKQIMDLAMEAIKYLLLKDR